LTLARLISLAAALAAPFAVSPASAFVATALLRESAAIPGTPAGHFANALNNTAVNHAGGYSVTVNTTNGVTTLSHVWGNASGGAGAILRTEGTFGPLVQTNFEGFHGLADAGEIAYSPVGAGGPVGSFDSVWLDDAPVAMEGDPVPTLAGQYWRFASRPGVTSDGHPYWVAGIASTPEGGTENVGLFYGAGATVVLVGGQVVPGIPTPLSTSNSVDFDYRYSGLGTHYIAPVRLAAVMANDDAIVKDGSGLTIGGTLVREALAVPAAAGGLANEHWGTLDFVGIRETGSWFFTGNTDAAIGVDEIVVRDGSVAIREGDVLDGRTLTGEIEGAYLNDEGDLALIWDVTDAVPLEALYVSDALALLEGDAVDLNGDGVVEAGSVLADFTGTSVLTLSDRDASGIVRAYFTADIDTAGTASALDDIEGFFCLPVATAAATSVASGGAAPPGALLLSSAPNPSAGLTRIRFELPRRSAYGLAVFDVAGRLVTRLEAGVRGPGAREIEWDGRDGTGRRVAPGTYFIRLDDGTRTAREKIVRLR
jgi:hypothetical protein